MKWLASLGGPRIDWPCGDATKEAASVAPRKAARKIRCMVTPCRCSLSSSGGIFMERFGRIAVLASILFATPFFAGTDGARGAEPYTTWTAYGGGAHSSQYSALDQINTSNVPRLEAAWTFPVTGTVIFNPLVVDNVMFLQASGDTLAAVEAASGKEIWRRQM